MPTIQYSKLTDSVIKNNASIKTEADVIKYISDIYNHLDLNFHPDDPFDSYVGQDDKPLYTKSQATKLDTILDKCLKLVGEDRFYELLTKLNNEIVWDGKGPGQEIVESNVSDSILANDLKAKDNDTKSEPLHLADDLDIKDTEVDKKEKSVNPLQKLPTQIKEAFKSIQYSKLTDSVIKNNASIKTEADVIKFVSDLYNKLNLNFYPDEPFDKYVDQNDEPIYTKSQALNLDTILAKCLKLVGEDRFYELLDKLNEQIDTEVEVDLLTSLSYPLQKLPAPAQIKETFKSKKQSNYFRYMASKKGKEGKKWKNWTKEWSEDTDFSSLPDSVSESLKNVIKTTISWFKNTFNGVTLDWKQIAPGVKYSIKNGEITISNNGKETSLGLITTFNGALNKTLDIENGTVDGILYKDVDDIPYSFKTKFDVVDGKLFVNKVDYDNCYINETNEKRGLWDNIMAKRERGEAPAKPGDKDYPKKKAWRDASKPKPKETNENSKTKDKVEYLKYMHPEIFANDGTIKDVAGWKYYSKKYDEMINTKSNENYDVKSKSFKDLPDNIVELVNAGKVTYRGTGMEINSPVGTLIKVDGQEYLISDKQFDRLGGIKKIRFSAPYRTNESSDLSNWPTEVSVSKQIVDINGEVLPEDTILEITFRNPSRVVLNDKYILSTPDFIWHYEQGHIEASGMEKTNEAYYGDYKQIVTKVYTKANTGGYPDNDQQNLAYNLRQLGFDKNITLSKLIKDPNFSKLSQDTQNDIKLAIGTGKSPNAAFVKAYVDALKNFETDDESDLDEKISHASVMQKELANNSYPTSYWGLNYQDRRLLEKEFGSSYETFKKLTPEEKSFVQLATKPRYENFVKRTLTDHNFEQVIKKEIKQEFRNDGDSDEARFADISWRQEALKPLFDYIVSIITGDDHYPKWNTFKVLELKMLEAKHSPVVSSSFSTTYYYRAKVEFEGKVFEIPSFIMSSDYYSGGWN